MYVYLKCPLIIKYAFIHVIQAISVLRIMSYLENDFSCVIFFFFNTKTFQDCIFLVIYEDLQNYVLTKN